MGITEQAIFATYRQIAVLSSVLLVVAIFGCNKQNEAAKASLPTVTVTKVIQRTIPEYFDYVGTTQAVHSVDIVARVEGFLKSRDFVDGSDVKKGDLLFVIDPKPFQAALESALGQLVQDEAQLVYANEQVKRYRGLVGQGYISRNAFEDYVTQAQEAAAAVESDKGAVRTARLNLGYTRMYAPFSGRMGRRLYDVGNLVGPGEDTKLAVLVQLDPIYVYFSPTETELPRILRQQSRASMPVTMFLADQSRHPYQGKVDFVDNSVDTATGTVKLRAVIPNPEKLVLPGQYARVRLLLGEKTNALVVPERAVTETQARQTVYVVGKDDTVESREVVALSTWKGMRVVDSGLESGERVIVAGKQKVKPGVKVKVKLVAAPATPTESADDQ